MYSKKGRTGKEPGSSSSNVAGKVYPGAIHIAPQSASLLTYLLPPRTAVEIVRGSFDAAQDRGEYREAVRRLKTAVLSGLAQRAELRTDKGRAHLALAEMARQRLPGIVCELSGEPMYEVRVTAASVNREWHENA